jgi:hypothetical protein
MTACRRCGYYETWTVKYDQADNPCGWTHEIDKGAGALWYRKTGGAGFAAHYLNSAQQVSESEVWLRNRLTTGELDAENSYLSRWNNETKQVELLVGKFYEWLES